MCDWLRRSERASDGWSVVPPADCIKSNTRVGPTRRGRICGFANVSTVELREKTCHDACFRIHPVPDQQQQLPFAFANQSTNYAQIDDRFGIDRYSQDVPYATALCIYPTVALKSDLICLYSSRRASRWTRIAAAAATEAIFLQRRTQGLNEVEECREYVSWLPHITDGECIRLCSGID